MLNRIPKELSTMNTASDARFWDRTSRKYAKAAIADQAGYELRWTGLALSWDQTTGFWNWAAEQEQRRSGLRVMCKAIVRRTFPLK